MNAKLVIVDGVNGTGRQAFAQRLYYSAGRDRSCWITEEADHNPLIADEFQAEPWLLNKRLPENDVLILLRKFEPLWKRFGEKVMEATITYILDGLLLEKWVRVLYQNAVPEELIVEKVRSVVSLLADVDPFLVFFSPGDYIGQLKRDFAASGERWRRHIVNEVWGVCKKVDHLGLPKEEKTFAFISAYGKFIEDLFGIIGWNKIHMGEETNGESILANRLSLTPFRYKPLADDKILGTYDSAGHQEDSLIITLEGQSAFCSISNTYFNNIELLRVADSRYALRGHPIELLFSDDQIELQSDQYTEYRRKVFLRNEKGY